MQQRESMSNCVKLEKKRKSITDFLARYPHQCVSESDHVDLDNEAVRPGPATDTEGNTPKETEYKLIE